MSNVTFTKFRTGSKLTPACIKALETQLGRKLPKDYRAFLLKYNGGSPDKAHFYVRTTGYPTWVDYFHSVDEHLAEPSPQADPETISFKHHAFGDVVPEDCLIIGMVCTYDLLLLRLGGKRRGHVALKVIEPNEYLVGNWGKHKERGVYGIAKSFTEFLEMLKPEDAFRSYYDSLLSNPTAHSKPDRPKTTGPK